MQPRPGDRRVPGIRRETAVARRILRWYRVHGRRLPWRDIRDPYRILVSEIMLQQTQVSRVLQLYPKFLGKFPTLRSLASAPRADVVLAWRGLGYNNRAVRLHRLAGQLFDTHAGKLPRDLETLLTLPGIGRYTAAALLVAVHGTDAPVVDVNIRRFFSRMFWRMQSTSQMRSGKEIEILSARFVPAGRGYDWTQALMDLGATVCTARAPQCHRCPVGTFCLSRTTMVRGHVRPAKREPSMSGVPNRIYRGRIVEELRGNKRGIRLDVLGRRIHPSFAPRHERWLAGLLGSLEKDGLVVVSGSASSMSSSVRLA
jgi:A/G-specific adenine glycosylase